MEEEAPVEANHKEEWTDNEAVAKSSKIKQPSACSKAWTNALLRIRKPISKALLAISGISARHPKTVIVLSIFVSLSVLGIGLFTNFNVTTDGDVLWTPTPSRVLSHGTWIEKSSDFPTLPRSAVLTIHANGENVLSGEGTRRIFTALDVVRNSKDYDTICKKASFNMKDSNGEDTCFINSPTRFWNYSIDTYQNNVTSDQDAIQVLSQTKYPDDTPVDEKSIYGYPQRNDEGLLTSSQMFSNVFYLPSGPAVMDEVMDVETNIIQNILDLQESWKEESGNIFRVELFTDRCFDDEFERAIVKDIPLVPMIFVVMSIFTCLVFARRNWVQSRSILGFGAVCTVLLSIIFGYGLLFIIGVPFTSMTQILPFIMFGIGLDDAFIIWGAYQRTDPQKISEERVLDAIEEVGISIFVTTITSIIAFSLGTISSIPAVYWLCYYAAPTIAIDFIFQITFFMALIVLDDRRVAEGRRDFLVCFNAPSTSRTTMNKEREGHTTQDSIFDKFMKWLSNILMKPVVKLVVIICFLGLTGGLGFAATKLRQEFEFTDVLPSPSYVADFWGSYRSYMEISGVAPYVIFREVDQSNSDMQEQMEQYVNDLVGIDAITYQPNFFWLRDFKTFIGSNNNLANASFTEQLDTFLDVPSFNHLYSNHIVRDTDGKIVTSRTRVSMDNLDQEIVVDQIDALGDAMDVSVSQPVNQGRDDWAFFTFDPLYYIFYFYTVTPAELLLTTVLGVSSVTLITLLFVPHWTSPLFIAPVMVMLYIDLLGFLQVCGLAINAVSYISLVMSIGLMVDFLLHILLRYYESKEATREDKVKEVIQTMGVSVLIGGLSTFLGVIPLAISSSNIFFTIFIAFLGLVVLGCTHGIILLPVLLSLLGPNIVIDFTDV